MSIGVLNYGWYDANSESSYPFDPRGFLVDDVGIPLPLNIVADISLSCLGGKYDFIFLSALTVQDRIVQLIFSGQAKITGEIVSLLSFMSNEAVKPFSSYKLNSIDGITSGFIVFGDIDQGLRLSSRYSSPMQVKVLERCISENNTSNIPYVTKYGTNIQARGVIKFATDPNALTYGLTVPADISPLPESLRTDDPVLLSCIGLSTADLSASDSVLGMFANGTNTVPESGNITGLPPIQTIGHVQPDCGGTIIIRFNDQFDIHGLEDSNNTVFVESSFELDEICGERNNLPDSDGKLPTNNTKKDAEDNSICPPDETEIKEVVGPPQPWPPVGYNIPAPDNYVRNLPGQLTGWTIYSGLWEWAEREGQYPIRIKDTYSLAGLNFGTLTRLRQTNSIDLTFQLEKSPVNSRYNVTAAIYSTPQGVPLSLVGQMFGAVVNATGAGAKDRSFMISHYSLGFWKPLAEVLLEDALESGVSYNVNLTGQLSTVPDDDTKHKVTLNARLRKKPEGSGSFVDLETLKAVVIVPKIDITDNIGAVLTNGSQLLIESIA